ncbi:MAG: hypothetical protein DHS80DRAFT_21108 [Piptocephalis tieghemiana]|nr:MAG: hypothetical protein DHS80DRAFT_21108 [Piptocephalis tieghemiana]
MVTRMVSYVAKDPTSGDLYFLCAGSQGNPTAVYRKTGDVEPGCVFNRTVINGGITLESTYAKGTYLGHHGSDLLSLGKLGTNYWNGLFYGDESVVIKGSLAVEGVGMAIGIMPRKGKPSPEDIYYPASVVGTKGDNQRVELVTKKKTEKLDIPKLFEVTWKSDPTAANNPK